MHKFMTSPAWNSIIKMMGYRKCISASVPRYIAHVAREARDHKRTHEKYQQIPNVTIKDLSQYFNQTYRNRSNSLYEKDIELIMLPKHKRRYQHLNHSQQVALCVRHLIKQCKSSRIIAIKTVRLKMAMVRDILYDNADMRVVYLVRDPRAILVSRWATRGRTYRMKQLLLETRRLCHVMEEDLRVYLELRSLYPDRMMMIKYEELSTDAFMTITEIYNFIKVPVPNSIKRTINQMTNGQMNNGFIGTNRSNSSITASRWKHALPNIVFNEMNIFCSRVINRLSYYSNI